MPYSVFGTIVGARRYANTDVEIDFFHDDKITELRYSSSPEKLGNLTKELADSLANTLGMDICCEIFFDDSENIIHIEFEECDDEEDEDFDDDSEEF